MRLKKEDVYINLRGKSKKELTDLYNFLESVGEKIYRDNLSDFIRYSNYWRYFEFSGISWCFSDSKKNTIVTIEQLKEIIKPNLQTQLENAKKEVERIENLIMEENKPKIGDICKFWDNDKSKIIVGKFRHIDEIEGYSFFLDGIGFKNCEKITNPELIKLLEDESK